MPPTSAQGGNMKTSSGVALPLQSTDVVASINGPIADVQVTQVFKNNTSETIEATYSFPLSHEGSVCRFFFKLGDRVINGVIKEKEEAKRTYEAAKERGQAATLLEQNKENLFTMSVANIKPSETISVNMGYQEKIPFDAGEYRFIFPLVATEAFDNSDTIKAPSWNNSGKTPTHSIGASDQRSSKVNMTVNIRSGVGIEAPKSLSHDVKVTQNGSDFEVQLAPTDSLPNRDFVIAYKLLTKEVQPVLYFENHVKQESGSFVLVITPPAPEETAAHAPCDVVFMVDRSYSMRGGSLEQCARAIEYLIEPLNEQDGVQLVTFDHDIESFDGTATWQNCTKETKEKMVKFVKSAKPRGGTELERALYAAIDILPQRSKKQKLICLLTDAAIGETARAHELCELIVNKENTSLYVLGVGPAVDRFAIQQLAKKANGVSEVLLTSETDLSTTVSRFRTRLLEAGPRVQNLSIDWDKSSGLELLDMFPKSLPDLFSGQPLQVCGRYKKASKRPVKITINGNNRDGTPFSASKEIVFPDGDFTENLGVQRTWAKFKIDDLTELVDKAQNEEEAKFEVIALSFQNVLMSKYTSFVAEEEDPKEKFVPITVTHAKEKVTIEGLKPSDRAKSILLRAAVACHTAYSSSSIKAGDKRVTAYDEDMLIKDLNLKNLELVEKSFTPPRKAAPAAAPTYYGGPISPRSAAMPLAGGAPPAKSAPFLSRMSSALRKSSSSSSSEKLSSPVSSSSSLSALAPASSSPISQSVSASRVSESVGIAGPASSYMTLADIPPPPASRAGPPPPPASPAGPPPPPASPAGPPPPPASTPSPRERAAPSPRAPMPPSMSRSSSHPASFRMPGSGPNGTSPLKTIDRKASPWAPSTPWLSADKMAFFDAQGKTLPERAVPTKTAKPVEYSKEETEWVKQNKSIGQMDLAFVVDETGSMGSWIHKVQQEIHNIIDSIKQSPLCKDVRVGLVGYRDHPPQDNMVAEVMDLTSDTTQIKKGVDAMYASGGGDGPECMTDGLYEAVRLSWRPTAARVVVVITDAPPHGLPGGEMGDGFPTGCPCGNHWYTQAACMREMGIVCYTVGCGISGITESVYRIIANATKGLYVNLTDVKLLIPLITGAAETALDRQRLQELLLEVVMENLEALQKIEDEDQLIAELLRLLRAKNVKLRALSVHANTMGMHFEDLTREDVQIAFDDLRRSEKVAL